MAKPIWQTKGKGSAAEELVALCAGRDVVGLPAADLSLIPADLWTNRAHAQVLFRANVLDREELRAILSALRELESRYEKGEWTLDPSCEDVHMALEQFVTEKTGEAVGGKLHTGRSRNDQVATDMRLWLRDALLRLITEILQLIAALLQEAEAHAETVMPGWTHQRPAMVTSWGSLLLGYASALERDTERLLGVFSRIDRSPLGAAAGYGTSWPLDRAYAAKLLAFPRVLEHPGDAVGNRWEPDAEAAGAVALLMRHLSTLAQDWITLSSPAYFWIGLPRELTTGSSIMPQKRNPDLLEVTRAKAAAAIGSATALQALGLNEMSGYQRDLQWSKYMILDLFRETSGLAPLLAKMLEGLDIHKDTMREACQSGFIEAVDIADTLARSRRVPFRAAYGVVSDAVARAESSSFLTIIFINAALADHRMEPLSEAEAQVVERREAALAERKNVGGPAPEQTRELVKKFASRIKQHSASHTDSTALIDAHRVACRDAEEPIDEATLPKHVHTLVRP